MTYPIPCRPVGGGAARPSESGLALITALMVLMFLSVIGAALLTSTSIDVTISDNYRTNAQLQFLAEAGVEAAREQLRIDVEAKIDANPTDLIDTINDGITAVLQDATGVDGVLADSATADILLDPMVTDDVPYLDAVPITVGGDVIGTYSVFLRNDEADGVVTTADSNERVTLVSVAVIGDSTRVIETVVKKGRFPTMPSALTLDGEMDPDAFGPGSSNGFAVDGSDHANPPGPSVNAVGVIDAASGAEVADDITVDMPDRSAAYTGSGGVTPDVADVSGALDAQVTTAAGMEALLAGMQFSATHTGCPSGNWGSEASPRITYFVGDCDMDGNDTGWGLFVVEGTLKMGGNVEWNGLVIVVDRQPCDLIPAGGTHYTATLAGGTEINGGLFVANLVGGMLDNVCMDIAGGGNGGIAFDSDLIRNAYTGLPFAPISVSQY